MATKPKEPECPYMPVNEALIVKVVPPQEQKTPGGVVLPGKAQRYEESRVVAVSPDLRTRDDMLVKPGMVAVYLAGSGDQFTVPEGTFKRLSVASIHCLRRTA